MSRSPACVVRSLLLAVTAVIALSSCSSANVSGGVSVSSGWYGPWGYDNYWYDTPGTVIVGPPIHPRPLPPPDIRPDPRPPRPVQPMPMPRPMPRMGGGRR